MSVSITQETQKVEGAQPAGNSLGALFRIRNFRLLFLGETISLLGDQFYLIALPWLVLKLTGDAFAMGTVLALGGIPRALFMLVGGAVTDRFTPRTVMLVSNIARLALVTLLAVLILTGEIQLWMIYALSLGFGLADAFFFPAQSAVVPRVVNKEQLQGANAIIQGTAQLSLFLGPVLAGVLIALFAGRQTGETGVPETQGIVYALLFDALTFVVSAVSLWMMRMERTEESASGETGSVIGAIREGLLAVWNDVPLRIFFILIAISNLLIMGPFSVGIPVLADTRLPEGAAAFGIIMSAFGGGSLVGIVLAGTLPRPPASRMGIILGVIWSGLGIGVLALGLATTTFTAALVSLGMGLANGYVVILFMTWLQRRIPESMMGRIMSLLMFASVGLQPIGNAVAGAAINVNLTAFFAIAGALMTVITWLFMRNPAVQSMEDAAAEAAV